MNPILRSLTVLFLSALLQACGDDLSIEDHVRNAETLLEQSRNQIVMVRLVKERDAIAELKAALKKDGNNAQVNLFLERFFLKPESGKTPTRSCQRPWLWGQIPVS